jgi:hypothetical protein
LNPRLAPSLLLLASLLPLAACATGRAARQFAPATDTQKEETRTALAAAQERAASLSAARLLYDAKISGGTGPAVPGTLAVTYDGRDVQRASLTGPFGKRVAEYDAGAVTGEDRQALIVAPGALRAVLSGAWPGEPSAVEGCDGDECLVVWASSNPELDSISGVVDRRERRLRSLILDGKRGKLVVTYDGEADPWPGKVTAREDESGRGLRLTLVAREPAGDPVAAAPVPSP